MARRRRNSNSQRRPGPRPLAALGERLERNAFSFPSRVMPQVTPERIQAIFNNAKFDISDQCMFAHEIEQYDDHVRGTLQNRRAAVTSMEPRVESGLPGHHESDLAAHYAAKLVLEPWFDQASDWCLGAVLKQFAACEIIHRIVEVDGRKMWMPVQAIEVEPWRWTFDDRTLELKLYKARKFDNELITPFAGEFMMHRFGTTSEPGDFGMVRAIAKLWFMKYRGRINWAETIDLYGVPFTDLTHPANMGKEEVDKIIDDYRDQAGQRVVGHPEGTAVAFHKIQENVPHESFASYVDRAMSRLLVGQETSQISTQQQQTGATLQGEVRDEVRNLDAKLLDASQTETYWREWTLWNFGPTAAVPKIERKPLEVPDPNQFATLYEAAQRLGLPLNTDQVYSNLGIERPPGLPDVLMPATPAPRVPGLPGLPFHRSRRNAVMMTADLRTLETESRRGARELAALAADQEAAVRNWADRIDLEGGDDATKFQRFLDGLGDLVDDIPAAERASLLAAGQLAAFGRGAKRTKEETDVSTDPASTASAGG